MYKNVLEYFKKITTIPRPSGHEEKICERLIAWAEQRDFAYKTDHVGNLVVYVPASVGLESKPLLTLQAHMDMVCVKAPGSSHDFMRDPLDLYEQDGWLRARNTTLGADNGMAIAMMLAVVNKPHGSLELFFTVDEERGLTGALEFDTTLIQSNYLVNLDTEDQGELCISSSGGARLDCSIPIQRTPGSFTPIRVTISGAKGGHSGVDINKKRLNAIHALLSSLQTYTQPVELYAIEGGQADNAIPADAAMIVGVENADDLISSLNSALNDIVKHFDEDQVVIGHDQTYQHKDSGGAIKNRQSIVTTISSFPLGVYSMHPTIPNLVETSCNLGIIKTESQAIHATFAPRSSNNEAMDIVLQQFTDHFTPLGADCGVRSRYPGRSQNPDDQFVKDIQTIYEKVSNEPVSIVAYHAGLECGAIVAKLPQPMQAVSLGPTIKDPHSIHERVLLSSVETISNVVMSIVAWK